MKVLICVLFIAAAVVGCSKEQSQKTGAPKDNGSATTTERAAPEVKLAALLADPKPYAGKEVKVTGTFSGACCPTDFLLKDGLESMEVYITDQCPMPDESKKHKPMQVVGTVQLRGDEVSLVANEVMFQ